MLNISRELKRRESFVVGVIINHGGVAFSPSSGLGLDLVLLSNTINAGKYTTQIHDTYNKWTVDQRSTTTRIYLCTSASTFSCRVVIGVDMVVDMETNTGIVAKTKSLSCMRK